MSELDAGEAMVARSRFMVKIPDPPNFLRTDDGTAVPVQDVDDKALRQIGKQWTVLLLAKARNRRKVAPSLRQPR